MKFKDADLIGYPVQVVVGKRGVESGDRRSEAPRDRRADPGCPSPRASSAVVDLLSSAP